MLYGTLGFIDTPAQRNIRHPGITWCADNGCFGKGYPGDAGWLEWLGQQEEDAETCLFATAPDVVGDATATLERSLPWLPTIRQLGFPAALVAQNGQENLKVPWDELDVLFLGGSLECLPCGWVWPAEVKPERGQRCLLCGDLMTEWKLGAAARVLAAEATAQGKHVHMGRVNSGKRYRYAKSIGCHSVDGTYLTFGPSKNLPKLLGWIQEK